MPAKDLELGSNMPGKDEVQRLAGPILRHFQLQLSNGATLRMPIVTKDAKQRVAVNDIFNHALWAHRIRTEATMEAEKNILPDMTDFYAKFAKGSGKRGAK